MAETQKTIKPQEGYQMMSLSSPADIVIGGAAAGVGKTFSLLLEPLKHILTTPHFGGVIFRRTTPQITAEGGLWDASGKLYNDIEAAKAKPSYLQWDFKCGNVLNTLKFSHLEYEKNIHDYQGAEIPFIGFDELTHFTSKMFFYLLTRNRSTCGVKPYIRCTTNPDPDSWVAEFIKWWIGEDGFPIPERNGVMRYFMRLGDDFIDGATFEEVYEKAKHIIDPQIELSGGVMSPKDYIKSYTFISGSIYQNKKLLEVNPQYLGNLMSLDESEKRKLLEGNWKVPSNDANLIRYDALISMFENQYNSGFGKKLLVDAALEGSNKLSIIYMNGNRFEDIKIVDRSNGKEVIEHIKHFIQMYQIPNNRIVFDADGVGGFIKGYLIGAHSFHGNAGVRECKNAVTNIWEKPNFENLKTQCYYSLATKINEGVYTCSERFLNTVYDRSTTIKERIKVEYKCIKKAPDDGGRRRIIKKEEMKKYLRSGESPDIFDTMAMGELLELATKKIQIYG